MKKNKIKKINSGLTHTPKLFGVTSHGKGGFTLIEVMIALGLFTVIMTIGIGAVLGVNSTHRKTQSMRAVIDNLSFLMEDMARSIRLGGSVFCQELGTPSSSTDLWDSQNNRQETNDGGFAPSNPCDSIAFEPYWLPEYGNASNQIIYYITDDLNNVGTVYKKKEDAGFGLGNMIVATSSDIDIDTEKSGFIVVGSSPDDDPASQPRVTIILIGTVKLGNASTQFNLQTTVSQRLLDVTQFN